MTVELQTSIISLGEGLDLSSSKLNTAPGSLLSCRNYEITDTKGLSRIDGYEPYDGTASPGLTNFYLIEFSTLVSPVVGDILIVKQAVIGMEVTEASALVDDVDDELAIDGTYDFGYASDTTTAATTAAITLTRLINVGQVVEVLADGTGTRIIAVITNLDAFNPQTTVNTLDLATASVGLVLGTCLTVQSLEVTSATEQLYYDNILSDMSILRSGIHELGYPAAGLHYFRDTLYAVAPTRQFVLRTRGATSAEVSGNWTNAVVPGTWLGNALNGATAWVIATSSITDGSGYERMYVDVVESDYVLWNAAIAAGSLITGATFAAGTATGATGLIVASTLLSTSSLTGTLWSAPPVQVQLDSGATSITLGWRPVNQGYLLNFANGTSATEFPTKLERSVLTAPTAATYYLTNGATTYSCQLVSYFQNDVTQLWVSGNANGTLQVRNLVLIAGSNAKIDSTFDLHSAYPIAAPTKVADITSDMTYNSLPTNPLLTQSNVRYEFVSANFYADANWDAFYGVSGVGRAFYYTGDLYAKIYTQADSTKDKPRHVAYHLEHLALGFQEGSVQMSVTGLPHSFNGDDGASDFGMGDRVTGLMPLNGDTLGVFCEQSIRAITGSTVDNFSQSVLAPNTGCIEYTLVNIGTPVYCNNSGIVSLEQSQKYGDFEGRPLSYQVNSWLRKRLNRISGRISEKLGVLAAIPVRTKNQYRLFFKDGTCLTMTVVGDGTAPKFTTQQLSCTLGTMIPFAMSSQTDENGEELLHFSHYDPSTGANMAAVYELDKGWGFAGMAIDNYLETNWFSGESPNQYFTVQKVRLHGITRGRASMKIAASGVQNEYTAEYNITEQFIDLPRTPLYFDEDGTPASSNTDLANRGMSIQLKITGRATQPEPSHICQVLVLQTKPGGKTDA